MSFSLLCSSNTSFSLGGNKVSSLPAWCFHDHLGNNIGPKKFSFYMTMSRLAWHQKRAVIQLASQVNNLKGKLNMDG